MLCTLLCVAHLHIAQARVHGHHPTKLRLLNSSPVNGPVAKPNYYGYDGYPNRRPTCSCADPVSVPLELDHRSPIPVGNRPEYVYPAGAYDEDEYGDNVCHDLPLSQPDGDCGAQVGVCPRCERGREAAICCFCSHCTHFATLAQPHLFHVAELSLCCIVLHRSCAVASAARSLVSAPRASRAAMEHASAGESGCGVRWQTTQLTEPHMASSPGG